ncbi:VWA domain-containing protein [Aliarcobacter butzleri]|uniref:VWA domain-containing protein n=1 Tax=Aliarcobacter butzleri TaxID=28197 RepID=UPI003AFAAB42
MKETVNAQGGTDNVDLVYTFKPAGDVTFTKAVFSADGAGSDYLIHSISYKEVSEGDSTTIVGSDEVAFKISTSNIPDPSKYDFKTTFPTADVKIVDKNTGEVLFEKTVNLDKDGKAIVTVRTDGTVDLKAEVSNVQGNFEEVDYKNAKTEVEASIKATASNDSFNTLEDTNYVLKTTDFGDNNQNVAKIKFDSLPANGTIYVLKSEYTGSMNDRAEYTSSENKVYIEVKAEDIVDISQIENGNVVFVPNKDTDADSSFKFSVSNGNGVFSSSYETKVNVIAVADKPDVEISITKIGATTIVVDGNGNESNSSGIKALDILKVNPNNNGQETIDNDYSYSGNDDITKNYQNLNSGATNITTDKGNDTLEFQSLDSKNINSGAGDDKVIINQTSSSNNIQLGEGNNSYTVAGSLNSGTTQSGAGNDTLIVNQGASNTVINLGDGNNTISIGEALNNSNISTGNGNDTLIVGQASDNNTISTGGGNDFVQLNHNVQGTKIDLGTGNDGIRLSNEGHVNFNTETLIDGGADFDTLYLNDKETDYWIEDANHNKITYSQYVQENKDINGYANKLFYIYEVDGNGTKQGSGFKIKNVEDIVFEKDAPKEVIIKAVEYKVDISAALTDKDGSETLSVVIKNVPAVAVLESTKYDVSKNSDGSWSVNFKEATTGDALLKIEDSLTMKVPESYKGEIDLKIEATSTEARDNEDGKNFETAEATSHIDAPIIKVDPNTPNTINGGSGDDILIGDTGGASKNIVAGKNYNIALVIDTSGSMKEVSGSYKTVIEQQNIGTRWNPNWVDVEVQKPMSRMELTIDALKNLANNLKEHDGEINVAIIDFSSTSKEPVSFNLSDTNALNNLINALNNLNADGGTNYEDAFLKTTSWFDTQSVTYGKAQGYENLTYFLTDGNPTFSNRDTSRYNNGSTTEYYDMKDAIDAFESLSSISSVNAVGIGNGINKDYLQFFDNTNKIGEANIGFGNLDSDTTIANFSNGGTTGINSKAGWTISGNGSVAIVDNKNTKNDYLKLVDNRDTGNNAQQKATTFTSQYIVLDKAGAIKFDYKTDNYNSVDSISYKIIDEKGEIKASGDLKDNSKFSSIETKDLSSGKYKIVFEVKDESNNNKSLELHIDNITTAPYKDIITAPVGETTIVNTASGLNAALQTGSSIDKIEVLSEDTIIGGAGDDIIFGDSINTDHLEWEGRY